MSLPTLSRRARALLRAVAGIGILIAVLLEVGGAAFVRGLAAVSPATIAAALALTALATVAAALRWRAVARRLDVPIGLPAAIGAYYRSQFLNSVLPGGVVGDVHRALAHGQDAGSIAQASRAVAAERIAGQAVQLAFAACVLAVLGVQASLPAAETLLAVVAVVALVTALAAVLSRRARRVVRRELALAGIALGGVGVLAQVVATSVVVVACHAATFVVACLAVGVHASGPQLAAVALLTVLAGAVPLGIGGWGPRETVAAWAFASLGLGAADGVAASTAFGVLATIAVTPGVVVLAASARRHPRDSARARAVDAAQVNPRGAADAPGVPFRQESSA